MLKFREKAKEKTMGKIKNQRQKKAQRLPFMRLPDGTPPVPEVIGVDFAPYQSWAREKLGFQFANPSLLVTAFTHRSYVNEHKKSARAHNERMEFLGDAVLELASTEYLFEHYDLPEGILTSWRAALVRTESIRDAGDSLGYEPLIRTSRGEQTASAQARLHIVANAFEALIGAIYLDKGFQVAREFIMKHIIYQIDDILESGSWRDPKSHLQEVSQREDNAIPEYRVVSEIGPDHEKVFVVGVFVNNVEMGRGEGSSKQFAQQEAAKEGLRFYKKRYWTKIDEEKKLARKQAKAEYRERKIRRAKRLIVKAMGKMESTETGKMSEKIAKKVPVETPEKKTRKTVAKKKSSKKGNAAIE